MSRTYWPRLCRCLSERGRFCSSLLQVRSWFRPDTKNLTTRFTPTSALGQAAAALSWSSSLDRQTRYALVLATLLHRLWAGTMQPTGLANAAFLLYASAPWSVAASADSLSKAQSLRHKRVGQGAAFLNYSHPVRPLSNVQKFTVGRVAANDLMHEHASPTKSRRLMHQPAVLLDSNLVALCLLAGILAELALMMPQAGGGVPRARLSRVPDPPAWSPETNTTFRTWSQDLQVWSILAAEMDPGQQCAAIVNKLSGAARELARNMSYTDLTTGGMINGQQLDPVTFLFTHLAAACAPLGEESRLMAMGNFFAFTRTPGRARMRC